MKITLKWKDRTFPGYYYDTDKNIIVKKTYVNNGPIEIVRNINGKPVFATSYPDDGVVVHPYTDHRDQLICNVDGNPYRMDWLVAFTVYGKPNNILRVIHLDGEKHNYHWENLQWFTAEDVVKEYLLAYGVDNINQIPVEWKKYTAPLNKNVVFEVSNYGDLKRDGIPVRLGVDNNGYFKVTYLDEVTKDTKVLFVHRMVAELFVKNSDPEHFDIVNHIDGDKQNCHFWNLEWCDSSANRDHATLNDLYNGKTSTEEMIEELCKALARGVSVKEICDTFHVTPKFVSAIYTRRRWTSISQKYVFPNNRLDPEIKTKIQKMMLDGLKGMDIAIKLDLPYNGKFISLYERYRRKLIAEGKLKSFQEELAERKNNMKC